MHHRGALLKWTNVVNGWQYRYCILQMDAGIMSYYVTKKQAAGGNRKGCVRLKNSIVGIDDEVSKHFTITDEESKTFYFEAQTVNSRDIWVKLLQNTIAQHSVIDLRRTMSQLQISSSPSTVRRRRVDARTEEEKAEQRAEMEEQFVHNLREADQFHQMIEHVRNGLMVSRNPAAQPNYLKSRDEEDSGTHEISQKKLNLYMKQSEVFIHAINNAIINLQIAKKNVFSEDRIRPDPLQSYISQRVSAEQECPLDFNGGSSSFVGDNDAPVSIGSHYGSRTELDRVDRSMLPICSYSSGDGSSDEFFDADVGFLDDVSSSDDENCRLNEPVGSSADASLSEISAGPVNSGDVRGTATGSHKGSRECCIIEPNRKTAADNRGEVMSLENTNTTIINLRDFERNGNIDCDDLFNQLRKMPAEPRKEKTLEAVQTEGSHLQNEVEKLTIGEEDMSVGGAGKQNVNQINNSSTQSKTTYDEDCDEDDLDLDTLPRSIITHLLSQIKIGFDLTTITLPIQILERRSLLEMFADFCATPQYVCNIAECNTPKDRFLTLLKWYFSAFKTGRKPISKKPYNPIIGEVFQCYYTLPSKSNSNSERLATNSDVSAESLKSEHIDGSVVDVDSESVHGGAEQTVSDMPLSGPVPWSSCDDVSFIAEQVSHHPPISCFYAESPSYNFQMTGHVWTKSKFLGLSIAVDMVGEATVKLLNHNESYRITFPSAYGRNILAVPWSELGGMCILEGIETGYKAEIEFRTRGGLKFTSVERDSVRVKVFDAPNRQMGSIQGLWTGKLTCNWNNRGEELFLDTNQMKPSKKRVRPLHEQLPNESRNKWQHVTKCLGEKNIEEAQKQKKVLEDVQRAEEGERKRNNEKFKPKYFETYKTMNGIDYYRFKQDLSSRKDDKKRIAVDDYSSIDCN